MPFAKGNKAALGRKNGSKNKTTEKIKSVLQQVYSSNIDNLQSDLDLMSPFQRQQILDKIRKAFLPDLSSVDMQNNVSGGIEISVSYKENKAD